MNRLILALLLLLPPLPLFADQALVVIDDSKPQAYLVIVGADKSVTVNPIRLVYPGPTPPTPTPSPNPPSPVLTDRAKAIQAAAEKVVGDANREQTAKALALLYREIAKLAPQATDVTSLKTAVSNATDSLLLKLAPPSNPLALFVAWQPVRNVLGTEWEKVKGKPADYGILLGEVADGLDASAPAKAGDKRYAVKDRLGNTITVGISPEIWALILEILKFILPLFIH